MSEPALTDRAPVANLDDRAMRRMSQAAAKVPGMSGLTGRYQARCGNGLCALTGDQATSKLQGGLFAVLNYVIGAGRQDARVSLGTSLARLDMIFNIVDHKLVVEYDGAYWHRGREEQDFRKARRVESWYWPRCIVVRVREYPLEATADGSFTSPDVQVPARVDAGTCAQLVLLHLLHVLPYSSIDYVTEDRLLGFLRSAGRPLERSSVLCETCKDVARHFRLPVGEPDQAP